MIVRILICSISACFSLAAIAVAVVFLTSVSTATYPIIPVALSVINFVGAMLAGFFAYAVATRPRASGASRTVVGARPSPTVEELRASRVPLANALSEAKRAYDPLIHQWKAARKNLDSEATTPEERAKIGARLLEIAQERDKARKAFYDIRAQISDLDKRIGAIQSKNRLYTK